MTLRTRRWRIVAILAGCLAVTGSISAQEDDGAAMPAIDWAVGPTSVSLGKIADVALPGGYAFASGKDTRTLLELMGNPTSGDELGLLRPEDGDWFVVFEFSDVGYIKDDEKNELDPDAILASIKKGTEAANAERRKRGWAELDVVGWEYPPRYDDRTNNLEWAVRGVSDGQAVINYNTRLLGRKGVMEASLVVDPEDLHDTVPVFKGLLDGYEYRPGNRYAEFREGDKVAAYGLAALVAGGAAAVALKTGLLQKFWKLIVLAVVAVGTFLKRIFGAITGRRAT